MIWNRDFWNMRVVCTPWFLVMLSIGKWYRWFCWCARRDW